jgi:spore coat polysaccharide biosynthesis protein SpsF (cytidylyltransferase family)
MGSTRLPGKVLMDIEGKPMVIRVADRVSQAKTIQTVVIATSGLYQDQALADICRAEGYRVFRGSEQDVLDRYYKAAKRFHADIIVRVCADCPLIDPEIIDDYVTDFLTSPSHIDYLSNKSNPLHPSGLDVEVFSMDALTEAWENAKTPYQREHVTPYMYDRQPIDKDLHWAVDTYDDLVFVRRIYHFFPQNRFTWIEALDIKR